MEQASDRGPAAATVRTGARSSLRPLVGNADPMGGRVLLLSNQDSASLYPRPRSGTGVILVEVTICDAETE